MASVAILYTLFESAKVAGVDPHRNAPEATYRAIAAPTEESVRRAVAIQMISSLEFGLLANENPFEGSRPGERPSLLLRGRISPRWRAYSGLGACDVSLRIRLGSSPLRAPTIIGVSARS